MHICLQSAPVTVHTDVMCSVSADEIARRLLSGADVTYHKWVAWQANYMGAHSHGPTTSKLHTQRGRHAMWKLTHVSMLCISLETSSSPVQQDSLVNGRLAVYVLAAF